MPEVIAFIKKDLENVYVDVKVKGINEEIKDLIDYIAEKLKKEGEVVEVKNVAPLVEPPHEEEAEEPAEYEE